MGGDPGPRRGHGVNRGTARPGSGARGGAWGFILNIRAFHILLSFHCHHDLYQAHQVPAVGPLPGPASWSIEEHGNHSLSSERRAACGQTHERLSGAWLRPWGSLAVNTHAAPRRSAVDCSLHTCPPAGLLSCSFCRWESEAQRVSMPSSTHLAASGRASTPHSRACPQSPPSFLQERASLLPFSREWTTFPFEL